MLNFTPVCCVIIVQPPSGTGSEPSWAGSTADAAPDPGSHDTEPFPFPLLHLALPWQVVTLPVLAEWEGDAVLPPTLSILRGDAALLGCP